MNIASERHHDFSRCKRENRLHPVVRLIQAARKATTDSEGADMTHSDFPSCPLCPLCWIYASIVYTQLKNAVSRTNTVHRSHDLLSAD